MKTFSKLFRVIAIGAVIAVGLIACASTPPRDDFPCVGQWKVTGSDGEINWTGNLVIVRVIEKNNFYGFFEWYHGTDEFVGKENFAGLYKSNLINIQGDGGSKITDSRLGTRVYQATLSNNSLDFESGTWKEGGTWTAQFITKSIPAQPEAVAVPVTFPPDFRGNWSWDSGNRIEGYSNIMITEDAISYRTPIGTWNAYRLIKIEGDSYTVKYENTVVTRNIKLVGNELVIDGRAYQK